MTDSPPFIGILTAYVEITFTITPDRIIYNIKRRKVAKIKSRSVSRVYLPRILVTISTFSHVKAYGSNSLSIN